MTDDLVALLHTEQRDPNTVGIGSMPTLEMLKKINDEDKKVAYAVERALPEIARAVDLIAGRMKAGGRMVYAGAGTSGRLGTLDASECPPTYGVAPDKVSCVIAGGREAVFRSRENVEDHAEQAAVDLTEWGLTGKDVVVAAAASGRTPYCIGALDHASSIGAGTVAISCNPGTVMSAHAQVAIEVDTGPEAIMGSTRMKAGTAQKMIMNMLSTAVMIRCGRTYDNLMVCVRARNGKIGNRMVRLFCEATGCTDGSAAEQRIGEAGGRLDLAVIMELTGVSLADACAAMEGSGDLASALACCGFTGVRKGSEESV